MNILLFKFDRNDGNFYASPPCVAIEAYFKLAGISYESVTKNALAESGSSTLPALRLDGELISDSENIIRHFENNTEYGLDGFLSSEENAQKTMLWRLMNGSIYQFMVAERWLDQNVYAEFVETFKEMLVPGYLSFLWPPFKRLIAFRVRGRYLKSLAHLSQGERAIFMRENFGVLSQLLGEKRYLFGNQPSSPDAYLYAYTYAFLAVPFDTGTKTMIVENYPNLVAYYQRMASELGDS
jgi:glutathione S-transferase